MELEESSTDTLDCHRDEQAGLRENEARNIPGAQNNKTDAFLWSHPMSQTVKLGKTKGGQKRGRPNLRWPGSITEATGLSLRELSRAAEERALWTPLGRWPGARAHATARDTCVQLYWSHWAGGGKIKSPSDLPCCFSLHQLPSPNGYWEVEGEEMKWKVQGKRAPGMIWTQRRNGG